MGRKSPTFPRKQTVCPGAAFRRRLSAASQIGMAISGSLSWAASGLKPNDLASQKGQSHGGQSSPRLSMVALPS
jgi:hypothetical protein